MGNEIEVEIEVAADAYDLQNQKWLSYSSSSSSSAASSSIVSVPLLPKIPNLSLNHVSFVCKSVAKSVQFYQDVLGFVLIERPSSFNFDGAWLFNYGIEIHLLESKKVKNKKGAINPKDNHISFQCPDLKLLEQRLDGTGIDYVSVAVTEGGIQVDQILLHDPDGYMVEISDCTNLPVLPITSSPLKQPKPRGYDMQWATMENLLIDMFNISI